MIWGLCVLMAMQCLLAVLFYEFPHLWFAFLTPPFQGIVAAFLGAWIFGLWKTPSPLSPIGVALCSGMIQVLSLLAVYQGYFKGFDFHSTTQALSLGAVALFLGMFAGVWGLRQGVRMSSLEN